MSFFDDVFGTSGGYQKAADAQSAGLTAGYSAATPLYGKALGAIDTNYTAALDPYTALNKTATGGIDAYNRALGIGGNPADAMNIIAATPGFQGELGTGLKAIDRSAASRGLLTSGNAIKAEQQYGSDLAGKYWNNYVSSLAPYIGLGENAAAGTAGVLQNRGNQTAGIYGNQGNLAFNTQAGIGAAQAGADINAQNAHNAVVAGVMNLGSKLLGAKGNSFGGGSGGSDVSGFGGGGGVDPTTLPSLGFGTPFLSGGFGVPS